MRSRALLALAAACTAPQRPPAAEHAAVTPLTVARPPTIDVDRHRMELAEAVNALPTSFDGTTHVVLSGNALQVNGEPAGDVKEASSTGKLRRLDALFDVLEKNRAAWKARYPGVDSCGCATLWVPRQTSLLVFKSIFQTAAFAGYPNLHLAVEVSGAAPPRVGYLDFDASVPFPRQTVREQVELHVDYLDGGDILLAWRVGTKIVRTTALDDELGPRERRLSQLRERLASEWRSYGGHQSEHDSAVDQAVIHAPNSLDVATFASLVDAVQSVRRPSLVNGVAQRVPAFNVTFKLN
jgi:hypothetical protein